MMQRGWKLKDNKKKMTRYGPKLKEDKRMKMKGKMVQRGRKRNEKEKMKRQRNLWSMEDVTPLKAKGL